MRRRWLIPLVTAVAVALVGTSPIIRLVDRYQAHEGDGEEEGFKKYVEAVTLLGQLRSRSSAPFSDLAPGALAAAVGQKERMALEGGRWAPLGGTPMFTDDPTYTGNANLQRFHWYVGT